MCMRRRLCRNARFGRFMNMKGAAVVPNVIADIREKQREANAVERSRAAAQWKEQAAERAQAEALVRSLYHVHARCLKNGGFEAVDFARAVLSHVFHR